MKKLLMTLAIVAATFTASIANATEYAYLVKYYSANASEKALMKELNRLGSEGWLLVNVAAHNDVGKQYTFYKVSKK